MQSELAIQINDGAPWNVDGGSHGVVIAFAMGNHDIEPVGYRVGK